MIRLLRSILKWGNRRDDSFEEAVKKAVERAVDGTDPWFRSVPGYRKRLEPSVIRAIGHVASLVDSLPPAVPISPAHYEDDPLLRAFFISREEMAAFFRSDWSLGEFLRGAEAGIGSATALLFMERKESTGFGAELSGDVIVRDVPQVTVIFESHRLIEPARDEKETRMKLKKRAFDYLVRVALQRITAARGERKELERQAALLQAKIDMLRRCGLDFDGPCPQSGEDVGLLEKRLEQVDAQLLELGGGDMLETYLDMMIDVLGRPEEFLRGGRETLILDSMRIRRRRLDANSIVLTLNTLENADGRRFALQMITIPVGEISGK